MGDTSLAAHHDCPPCPACGRRVATPTEHAPDPLRYVRSVPVVRADLFCPACGHGWREDDTTRVERAWKAWQAWERKQAKAAE